MFFILLAELPSLGKCVKMYAIVNPAFLLIIIIITKIS